MYKVILVDDDYLVLEFFNQMIPWEELGFNVVGSFENGELAFNFLQVEETNVILTDIGMPVMDGINLIKSVKEMDPTVHSIILTCHDDFKYAQQAIKLETFDYVLKESMNVNGIIDIIKRLKVKIDNKKNSDVKKTEMEYLIRESFLWLKSKFLHSLIENKPEEQRKWKERLGEKLGLTLNFEKCIPIICYVDRLDEIKELYGSYELINYSVDNVVNEILSRKGDGLSIFYEGSKFFIFYPLYQKSEAQLLSELEKLLREIRFHLKETLKVSITQIIGRSGEFPGQTRSDLIKLIDTKDQRFYMENDSVARRKPIHFSENDIFASYMEAVQEFKTSIIQRDIHAVTDCVEKWMDYIRDNKFAPDNVREWVIKVIFDIKLKFNSLLNFESNYSVSVSDNLIIKAESIDQIDTLMRDIFTKLTQNIGSINQGPKRNEVLKAQKFVLTNLNQKITLKEVAEHLHLNPSYFSRLYKMSTNENFIDYVIRMKMDRAKELIENSNETIETVAVLLGFESKSYFVKTFKKNIGVPPREYKYNLIGSTKR